MTRAILIAAVVVATINITMWPWSTFVGHSHWAQVEWVPFSQGVRPFDIGANIVLFVPFGWALAMGRGRRVVLLAVLAGVLLSSSIELLQVYCHGHFPTSTDVLANTGGTWLGAHLATRTGR